jgi:cyclic pyranopterin phosphate synthase
MGDFTHINELGKATMVDVAHKPDTIRMAKARSIIYLPDEVMVHFANGDIHAKKGAVFQTAIIAGIMAAKKTGDLIPLCHPIGLSSTNIDIAVVGKNEVQIICTANVNAKTGVEMEALVGASIAALTVYDMCKAMSHEIVIKETKLIEKTGGKSDFRVE